MKKRDFPVHDVRRYLEPEPIVLVSSKWRGRTNIMTLGWHTILEFSPSLGQRGRQVREAGQIVSRRSLFRPGML
jgi:hypothetical protein